MREGRCRDMTIDLRDDAGAEMIVRCEGAAVHENAQSERETGAYIDADSTDC